MDGDGTPDLIVAAYGVDPGGIPYAGSALVYSGSNGALLKRFDSNVADDRMGKSVARAGDIDGDGQVDLLIGATGNLYASTGNAGAVYLDSGADASLLQVLDGAAANDLHGTSVSGVGDLDGDGLAEVIVGAPYADPGELAAAGSTLVYSFDPCLHPDSDVISSTSGVALDLHKDFPVSEAGILYAVLLSATGTGPTSLLGLEVPLTADPLFHQTLTGSFPAGGPIPWGLLDSNGNADDTLQLPTSAASFVGSLVYLAAIAVDPWPQSGGFSSVARVVKIIP